MNKGAETDRRRMAMRVKIKFNIRNRTEVGYSIIRPDG